MLSSLVEITGPIQITVTLLQSMHGALPGELNPHSVGNNKSTTHSCAVLLFLVEITGIEPVTSCMPCKRSPEPRTHAPPHKGAEMIDIRRYNALFRERRILTQKQLCCLNEFY